MKTLVLSDEHCFRCEGYGSINHGTGPYCDVCRGTGGRWLELRTALQALGVAVPEPKTLGIEWLCEHGHKHQTREGAASCLGEGQPATAPKPEAESVRLIKAIREALEAAEEEGVHVHRGTDEPREFVTILRKALK